MIFPTDQKQIIPLGFAFISFVRRRQRSGRRPGQQAKTLRRHFLPPKEGVRGSRVRGEAEAVQVRNVMKAKIYWHLQGVFYLGICSNLQSRGKNLAKLQSGWAREREREMLSRASNHNKTFSLSFTSSILCVYLQGQEGSVHSPELPGAAGGHGRVPDSAYARSAPA